MIRRYCIQEVRDAPIRCAGGSLEPGRTYHTVYRTNSYRRAVHRWLDLRRPGRYALDYSDEEQGVIMGEQVVS